MPQKSDNTVLNEEQFIGKYISFIKALSEAETKLPEDYKIKGAKVRLELFQFFFVDGRNQQDMARIDEDIRNADNDDDDDDDDDDKPKKSWWDQDDD